MTRKSLYMFGTDTTFFQVFLSEAVESKNSERLPSQRSPALSVGSLRLHWFLAPLGSRCLYSKWESGFWWLGLVPVSWATHLPSFSLVILQPLLWSLLLCYSGNIDQFPPYAKHENKNITKLSLPKDLQSLGEGQKSNQQIYHNLLNSGAENYLWEAKERQLKSLGKHTVS